MVNIFVLNENSLKNKMYSCVENITDVCDRNDLPHIFLRTKSIEDLKKQIAPFNGSEEAVLYAVGGDGTLQALVNSVDLSTTTLQYLPYGSGNNAYRTFYGVEQRFDLEKDILSENIIEADLGMANGEYFTCMLGLAIDARIGNNLSKFRNLKVSGKMKYYLSILYTLLREADPVTLKMIFDGMTIEQKSSFISITNGQTIGGQTPINPAANAFDGKLNAVVTEALSTMKLLGLFTKIDKGTHLDDSSVVKTYEFEKLLIESDGPLIHELDGEIRESSIIDVSVCPKVLKLKGKRY